VRSDADIAPGPGGSEPAKEEVVVMAAQTHTRTNHVQMGESGEGRDAVSQRAASGEDRTFFELISLVA
jgi:hypothetical protein